MTIACPFCNNQIEDTVFYCPICGKKIKDKPVSTTISAQTLVYALSIFAPPFGIGLTLRYLKSSDPKAKKIGVISLILTVAALIVVGFLTFYYTQKVSQEVDREMQQYLGF